MSRGMYCQTVEESINYDDGSGVEWYGRELSTATALSLLHDIHVVTSVDGSTLAISSDYLYTGEKLVGIGQLPYMMICDVWMFNPDPQWLAILSLMHTDMPCIYDVITVRTIWGNQGQIVPGAIVLMQSKPAKDNYKIRRLYYHGELNSFIAKILDKYKVKGWRLPCQ